MAAGAAFVVTATLVAVPALAAPVVRPDWPQGLAHTPTDILDQAGQHRFTSVYGGMDVLKSDESRIRVYLTRLDPVVEREMRALVPKTTLAFAEVPKTLVQLDAMNDRVKAAATRLRGEGVDITEFGPDEQDGREHIGIDATRGSGEWKKDVALLDRAFGAGNIRVHRQEPAVATG